MIMTKINNKKENILLSNGGFLFGIIVFKFNEDIIF